MAALMLVLAILAGLLGVATFGTAASAIQEAVGGLFWLMAAVLLGAAGIINAVDKVVIELRKAARTAPAGDKGMIQPSLSRSAQLCKACGTAIPAGEEMCVSCGKAA